MLKKQHVKIPDRHPSSPTPGDPDPRCDHADAGRSLLCTTHLGGVVREGRRGHEAVSSMTQQQLLKCRWWKPSLVGWRPTVVERQSQKDKYLLDLLEGPHFVEVCLFGGGLGPTSDACRWKPIRLHG